MPIIMIKPVRFSKRLMLMASLAFATLPTPPPPPKNEPILHKNQLSNDKRHVFMHITYACAGRIHQSFGIECQVSLKYASTLDFLKVEM